MLWLSRNPSEFFVADPLEGAKGEGLRVGKGVLLGRSGKISGRVDGSGVFAPLDEPVIVPVKNRENLRHKFVAGGSVCHRLADWKELIVVVGEGVGILFEIASESVLVRHEFKDERTGAPLNDSEGQESEHGGDKVVDEVFLGAGAIGVNIIGVGLLGALILLIVVILTVVRDEGVNNLSERISRNEGDQSTDQAKGDNFDGPAP